LFFIYSSIALFQNLKKETKPSWIRMAEGGKKKQSNNFV